MGEASTPSHIQYSTVLGYFLQDDPKTNDSSFDYTFVNFGLIDRSYTSDGHDADLNLTQWQRFEHEVDRLNREAERNVHYKLLYMGRHGDGLHNVAEAFYGTPAWNCYWSRQDGNGTVVWADAHLTELGVAQAEIASRFWAKEIAEQHIPTAQTYYTSPLTRCTDTANITFSGLKLPGRHPFVPTVKELLREAIGIHTCDRRSTKTYIHNRHPTYDFEYGFTEDDELWRADVRETDPALDTRMRELLDDVFSHDDSTFISFTSHSGAIGGILRVIGHRTFNLATGAVIPALVKAETVSGSAPPGNFTWAPQPTCGPNGP
ncbi:Histidine phosphatase superfamily, clade-1 [Lasallia pustulata]|uniref:Histidine phosphatase superfamily, clade-1 n=1 Tax=Lasallia pustulata TaxID=136370 RepID=A0A1W5DDE9_9LECA|nr:Histidine phosphatase superfamily, clade-1 [Lasallia pustulata]